MLAKFNDQMEPLLMEVEDIKIPADLLGPDPIEANGSAIKVTTSEGFEGMDKWKTKDKSQFDSVMIKETSIKIEKDGEAVEEVVKKEQTPWLAKELGIIVWLTGITYNLQPSEWYKNSTDNDLLYWGLDYPPLTAYHSWVNGFIGKSINESWVRLHTSRGTQGYDHKVFMRSTVLISDVVIYFTGLIYYFMVVRKPLKPRERGMLATIGLMYPALILIEHGHFQYKFNSVSLGFTVWTVVMLMSGRYFLGSVFYCLALNYKQMSLYYSFSFFFFLLGICFQYPNRTKSMITLATISSAVIMTFIACWFPYIWDSETFLSVVYRLFPISRGLYEDKVDNIWCSLEVLIKLKRLISPSNMDKISVTTTLYAFYRQDSRTGTSLIFFLLSFQVHEKTIFLVALSVTLLIQKHLSTMLWLYIISTFRCKDTKKDTKGYGKGDLVK
ncbi:LOW QUALITY PROTEIN: dolichyl pyrophosphate Man9GlcNAc2 alpha-1,3-glucosyltransferase-like [Tetranychus urticae]|uniref:LOW QUALITY PROTEIN: dolichyl pyrophosphate Man9GlcNAc2 alpha-1,3-glucosyltransferase-like n=1 Tax=Tetranychus urticae TaxID=32264 RepID=UPI000D6539A6|nr:LOW QUALITY PROTEIN: dolichyl pyrophosphate Man9GlcNAc2 alpha-1,3-glucosyltransferase-like [Tetranychus urticae]